MFQGGNAPCHRHQCSDRAWADVTGLAAHDLWSLIPCLQSWHRTRRGWDKKWQHCATMSLGSCLCPLLFTAVVVLGSPRAPLPPAPAPSSARAHLPFLQQQGPSNQSLAQVNPDTCTASRHLPRATLTLSSASSAASLCSGHTHSSSGASYNE